MVHTCAIYIIIIVVRPSYLLRIDRRIRLPADLRNNIPCAMTLVLLRRGHELCHWFDLTRAALTCRARAADHEA